MGIKLIKADADYQAAIKVIKSLTMAEPDKQDGEKLDVMVTLIQTYEAKHFQIGLPDSIETIKLEVQRKALL